VLEVALPSRPRPVSVRVEGEVVTGNVVIGMDPHKRSATIEVMSAGEAVLGGGRFATDAVGYREMVNYAKQWPARSWGGRRVERDRSSHRAATGGRG
jgi:hypothetical protein